MRLRFRLFCLCSVLLAPLAAEPLPVSMLYSPPTLARVGVSANGELLALVTAVEDEQQVVVVELAALKPRPVARLGFSRVSRLEWKGDDWLLLEIDQPNGTNEFRIVEVGTGKTTAPAVANHRGAALVSMLPADPEHVLVALWGLGGRELHRLAVRTGKLTLAEKDPGSLRYWLVAANGQAVAGVASTSERTLLYWRKSPGVAWSRQELGSRFGPRFTLLDVHPDQHRLLAQDQDHPQAILVALDPDTLAAEPMFEVADGTPLGIDVWGTPGGRPRAVFYETDRVFRRFLDPKTEALQREIDRALPDTVNSILSASTDETRLVILASSPQDPGRYFLLDRRAGRLMPLGPYWQDCKPAELGSARRFQFTTRDGLVISGRLLVPPGNRPAPPAVVMLGSSLLNVRTYSQFHLVSQVLATRGYAVVSIDYRGTRGYGREFEQHGLGQLTTGMPADLADGVAWLGGQGWIDPRHALLMSEHSAGWLALHALSGTKAFAGWMNFETPMDSNLLQATNYDSPLHEYWGIVTSRDELMDLGVTETPTPAELLQRVTVPTFHSYLQYRDATLRGRGLVVDRYQRRNPQIATLVTRRSAETVQENRDNWRRIYEQMFAFLARHFPTAENPAPPSP